MTKKYPKLENIDFKDRALEVFAPKNCQEAEAENQEIQEAENQAIKESRNEYFPVVLNIKR